MANTTQPIVSPLDSAGNFNWANFVQALQGVVGQSGNTSGNTNTQSSSAANTNGSTNGILQQLTQMLQQVTGQTTNASSTGGTSSQQQTSDQQSALAVQALQGIIPQLQGQLNNPAYSKQQAIADSQGGVQQILTNLKEQQLPTLNSAEAATGGYKGTTKMLLSNDAQARAVAQAAALQQQTIGNYAAIQQNQNSMLLNAVNSAVNAQKQITQNTSGVTGATTTGTTTSNTNTNQSTNVDGTSSSTNASTTNQTNLGNSATTGNTTAQGLVKNPSAQILSALAAIPGLSSIPGFSDWYNSLKNSLTPSGNETPIPAGVTDPGAGGGMDFGNSDPSPNVDIGTPDFPDVPDFMD